MSAALNQQDHTVVFYMGIGAAGEWPGYSPDIEVLSLPSWAFPKSESDEIEVEYV